MHSAKRVLIPLLAGLLVTVGLVACGEGGDENGTTTVEQAADTASATQVAELERKLEEQKERQQELEAQQEQQADQAAQAASEPAPEAEPEAAEPPDVVGLTLPKAESALRSAGFKPDVSNTDTMFGIVIKSNYTVCKQDAPRGSIVPILAQKYGC
jgi:sRNA-binding protein